MLPFRFFTPVYFCVCTVSSMLIEDLFSYFQTPLHVAALGNKHRFVALLLEHFADPSLTNTKDELPLDLAVAANDSDQCVRLITVEMGTSLYIFIKPTTSGSYLRRVSCLNIILCRVHGIWHFWLLIRFLLAKSHFHSVRMLVNLLDVDRQCDVKKVDGQSLRRLEMTGQARVVEENIK